MKFIGICIYKKFRTKWVETIIVIGALIDNNYYRVTFLHNNAHHGR